MLKTPAYKKNHSCMRAKITERIGAKKNNTLTIDKANAFHADLGLIPVPHGLPKHQ